MTAQLEKNQKKSSEVAEKTVRRRFTTAYKLQIVEEADRCTESGQLGELLRREGLYSSQLSQWRRLRDAGTLGVARRGRKGRANKKEADEVARIKRENKRLSERLRQAEAIIDVQKKVCEMLGIPTRQTENDE